MMGGGTFKGLQAQIMYDKKCLKIWMNVDFNYTSLGLRENPELNSSHNFWHSDQPRGHHSDQPRGLVVRASDY